MSDMDPKNGGVHGTSKVTPVEKEGRPAWLPWLLGLLALLLVLFLLSRSCSHQAPPPAASTTVTTTTSTAAAAPTTPPAPVEKVTLPGGQTLDLQPATLNYELQRFLGSADPAPRTFTFDHLNFATDSAELPADADQTVGALAQILAAYPKAKVQLAGYADATGSDSHNVQLGRDRATAVQTALAAKGVAADRMSLSTGGSSNPVETNASSQGRAENRRTELVVTAK